MISSSQVAFKEWSVICAALATGRQSLILRKGGIHEGREGFQVAHDRFWLFPTHYHEAAQSVTSEGLAFLPAAQSLTALPGRVRLELLAEVQQVRRIADLDDALALASFHIWSAETVRQRFHYREPGLFALLIRVYKSFPPLDIADEAHFAGCRSWVEFGSALPSADVRPVLSDPAFDDVARSVADAWSSSPRS